MSSVQVTCRTKRSMPLERSDWSRGILARIGPKHVMDDMQEHLPDVSAYYQITTDRGDSIVYIYRSSVTIISIDYCYSRILIIQPFCSRPHHYRQSVTCQVKTSGANSRYHVSHIACSATRRGLSPNHRERTTAPRSRTDTAWKGCDSTDEREVSLSRSSKTTLFFSTLFS